MASKQVAAKAVILDSSCWLEVFDGNTRGKAFESKVAQVKDLIVPVITVYEVYKYLRRTKGEELAAQAATYMQQGQIVDLDLGTALDAASNGLPFADSLIYATAQLHQAELWTQDAHFEGLAGVKYFPKVADV
jgi:predicted nucleic acid-binding protein